MLATSPAMTGGPDGHRLTAGLWQKLAALAFLLAAGCTGAPASRPSPSPSPPTPLSFALIGDLPYTPQSEAEMGPLIQSINDDPTIAFTIHDGDIKGGGQPCDDAVYLRELSRFGTFQKALVYTPGDNEWTDCYHPADGGFNPVERLNRLREVFFSNPTLSQGRQPIALQYQPGYPENARWAKDGITFATVHVVGSNNFRPARGIPGNEQEFRARTDAGIEWIKAAFAGATDGVVIAMQANMLEANTFSPSGYDELLTALHDQAAAFGKPVLLVHGDTHLFRVGKPVVGTSALPNLIRVETFGEPVVAWVKVTIDKSNPDLFHIESKFPTVAQTRSTPAPASTGAGVLRARTAMR